MRGKSDEGKHTKAREASPSSRRPVVGGDALENLKRRAADFGLIIYKRGGKDSQADGGKRGGRKR